jgi:hypothetical protein
MKRQVILCFALLAVQAAIGCGTTPSREEHEFQRKEECASHAKEATEDFKRLLTQADASVTNVQLDRIFYSPKRNSCLYMIRYEDQKAGLRAFELRDFLTKGEVWGSAYHLADPEDLKKGDDAAQAKIREFE